MGRKNKNSNHNKSNAKQSKLPRVSVCTPTFNRRPFIPSLIKCFKHQDYPMELVEWIIIDDGTDKVEDLFKDIPNVKYFKYDEKMSLGKKRNIMHEKSSGEFIVYMDDDDYYPPQRISHAVDSLMKAPSALCAGSSEIYIYFHELKQIYQFGPYSKNHATAGTFAFRRKLLEEHKYNDEAALAEEKAFLKNYTVPFVQLDPKKVILVFSHEHNTFDKRKLLNGCENNSFIKKSDKTVDCFVKQEQLKQFYMYEIHELLKDYPAGEPSNKPDVIKQTKEIEERRSKDMENSGKIVMQDQSGNNRTLTSSEVVDVIKTLQKENAELKQGGIMMETPNGEKRILTNQEITTVIKKLQDDNRRLNDLNMMSTANVENNTQQPENKVFIFTDADDNMEVIPADEVNGYVTKQIQEIRELREQLKSSIQDNTKNTKQVSKQKPNTNSDVTQLLKTFKKEMLTEVKNTILTAMYGEEEDETTENGRDDADDSPIKVSIKVK